MSHPIDDRSLKKSLQNLSLPSDREVIAPKSFQDIAPKNEGQSGELSTSPWAKMFPSGATKEELAMFINTYVRDLLARMRHEDQRFKESMDRQRRMVETGEP